MKNILVIPLILIISLSCSTQDKKVRNYLVEVGNITKSDYIDHFANVGDVYINDNNVEVVKISSKVEGYLTKVYERIISNNQQLLESNDKPSFYFIKHNSPFLFSLPKSKFYFSTALMSKYLKSEDLFIAAFAAEIIRSQRAVYEKKQLVPTGVYTTERMIQLTKLKPETKQQVNEWTYFVLKRAGYDATAYLNWIQTQNRNTLDFAFYLGDLYGISREEHQYKNFITKQGIVDGDRSINETNSSKDFYALIQNITR